MPRPDYSSDRYNLSDLDRRLDRDAEREPTVGTDRRRIPLDERGALRVFFQSRHRPTPTGAES